MSQEMKSDAPNIASNDKNNCYTTTPQHFGHTEQYWIDFTVNVMPFYLFVVFVIILALRTQTRTKKTHNMQIEYYKKYEESLERQEKSYLELQNISKILAEILQKLDKNL